MPFSRHWIMHTKASLRIKNKLHSRVLQEEKNLEAKFFELDDSERKNFK